MRPSRRRAGAALLAVAGLSVLVGCGSSSSKAGSSSSPSSSSGGKSIAFSTFGGRFDKPVKAWYVDPTEKATGLKIALDSPTDYSKLKTQVTTGNVQWSVVMGDPFYAKEQCGKLLAPIDKVVNRSALDPKFIVSKCSVPGDQFSDVLMYSKKVYGNNGPKNWADFFNTTKFPGKRGLFGGYVFSGILEAARLAEGVPVSQIYPIDIKKTLEKVKTIRSSSDFFETLAAGQQLMESGEVSMIIMPQENGMYANENGANFAPVWNQQITSWNDYFVPKGANVADATKLLDTIASETAQNGIASVEPVGVSLLHSKAASNQPKTVQEWSPLVENRASSQVIVNQTWWAEHLEKAQAEWTAYVSG
jgi:putative spermidine/putrescine transport system substrate-binding protein